MEIHSVVPELLYEERRTQKHEEYGREQFYF
jgi:hypothetical protein